MLDADLSRRTKINIGCGFKHLPGHLNIDVDPNCGPDFLVKDHDLSMLPQRHYEEVVAHDVIEHIPRAFTMHALMDWSQLLKHGGVLDIETSFLPGLIKQMSVNPSFASDHNWMTCLFGNQAHSGDFHFNCFTEITLKTYLTAAGFSVSKFDFADMWLIRCRAVKQIDPRDFLRPELPPHDYVEAVYQAILGREPEPIYIQQLKDDSADEQGRLALARRLISSQEHLYRVGATL